MSDLIVEKAAVIGNPIAHSLSPQLHIAGWGAQYFPRIELQPGEFASFLNACDDAWIGCAVTMPFKFEALQAADMVDGLAKTTQVANTIVFQPTGSNTRMTVAFNTDVAGIVNAVREIIAGNSLCDGLLSAQCSRTGTETGAQAGPRFANAVILGSGATASSALAAVIQLGADDVTICARRAAGPNTVFQTAHRIHFDLDYRQIASASCVEKIMTGELIVSTLPARVADSVADNLEHLIIESSADVRNFLKGQVLLDVSYDPYPSRMIRIWERFGGTVVPGWLMLLHQAIDQARLFTGKMPDIQKMREALAKALQKNGS